MKNKTKKLVTALLGISVIALTSCTTDSMS